MELHSIGNNNNMTHIIIIKLIPITPSSVLNYLPTGLLLPISISTSDLFYSISPSQSHLLNLTHSISPTQPHLLYLTRSISHTQLNLHQQEQHAHSTNLHTIPNNIQQTGGKNKNRRTLIHKILNPVIPKFSKDSSFANLGVLVNILPKSRRTWM